MLDFRQTILYIFFSFLTEIILISPIGLCRKSNIPTFQHFLEYKIYISITYYFDFD